MHGLMLSREWGTDTVAPKCWLSRQGVTSRNADWALSAWGCYLRLCRRPMFNLVAFDHHHACSPRATVREGAGRGMQFECGGGQLPYIVS